MELPKAPPASRIAADSAPGRSFVGLDAAHAAPAAPGDRLDEQREADLPRSGQQDLGVVGGVARGQHGDPRGTSGAQCLDLVPGELEDLRRRADEGQTGVGAGACEGGVLRQEAVPRVDGVRARLPGDPQDLVDVEVGAHRVAGLADRVGLVGLESVLGVAVLVGIDRDGARTELERGAERAHGDLSTIGDENLGEHDSPHPRPGIHTVAATRA